MFIQVKSEKRRGCNVPIWNGEIMQRGNRNKVGAPELRSTGLVTGSGKAGVEKDFLRGASEGVYAISSDIPSESERTDKSAEQFYEASVREVEQQDFMLDLLEGIQDQVSSAEFDVLSSEVNAGKLVDEFALQSRIKTLEENRKTYSFQDWANDRNRMTSDDRMAEEIANQEAYADEETGDSIFSEAFDGVNEDVFSVSTN